MKFIVKDLMISVLPFKPGSFGGECDAGPTCACTCTPCTGGCSPCSDCSKCTTTTPGESWWNDIVDPERLAALKAQLTMQLAMVEAREKVVHESLRPKSAAEIQMLESHLTAALEALRAHKP